MDLMDLMRFAGALGFVLALIGLAALAVRRFGLVPGVEGRLFEDRRLGIVESLALDPRRRLIIVRRDDKEHLILLGASGETLVETLPAQLTRAPFAGVSVFGRPREEAEGRLSRAGTK